MNGEIKSVSLQVAILPIPGNADVSSVIGACSLQIADAKKPNIRDAATAIGACSLSMAGYSVNGTATTHPDPLPALAIFNRKKRFEIK